MLDPVDEAVVAAGVEPKHPNRAKLEGTIWSSIVWTNGDGLAGASIAVGIDTAVHISSVVVSRSPHFS